ncbi:glutamine--fructose-6-phosphate transaminase (isomerizing) [uncultured Fusobacterium sp.]|jgi:glucosamine--fructose-6-phosphate aminotransferase (isomerizing)|uniref:glutamine--fructose-6-phosphate transaminase (isomerizing) n=1 Tax=uncultured Fusobacterium sp. TaxID=159267 RepID=UPI0025D6730B|nr:glutamine--fructose-6-phosphate transaminase (isomerizing) [uncultured Fusobacterium sp.]MCF2640644.1 glutamine--fructose-6-phosphate transaminase (isomerizing) [Fusobacterium varium]
MCGIIGYVGNDQQAVEVILDGLSKLEYRGYDSAGLAVVEEGRIFVDKKSGKLSNLKESLKEKVHLANVGIGHTRWATHGVPSDINSHPHCSCDGKVAIVHNGIIENYSALKSELIGKGYKFISDTDSEVVAQLFSYFYNGDLLETLKKVTERLRGSYALGIIHEAEPEKIVCARKESPLIIGVGKNSNFIASDVPAILKYTRDVIFLENDEIAILEREKVRVYDKNLNSIEKSINKIQWDMEQASKNGYPHFMLKEIEEQPEVVNKTLEFYTKEDGKEKLTDLFEKIDFSKVQEIDIIACGTAYYAGLQGANYLKKIANFKSNVEIASEYRYSDPIIDERNVVVFVSQSGETLDTLMALRLAKSKGAKTIAITNVVGSTISREADVVIYTLAGPEISVASTKAYTAQVITFYLLSLEISLKLNRITEDKYKNYILKAYSLNGKIKEIFNSKEKIKGIAETIKDKKNGFYIGRGIDEKVAREGSLKMKEITYIHTEAFPAGELKHGTIALIENGTMVVVVATQEDMIEKVVSNIKELKARGAYIISITKNSYKDIIEVSDKVLYISDIDDILAPVLAVIPAQLFAYYTAVAKGLDVDKPRNLAKSVTVE